MDTVAPNAKIAIRKLQKNLLKVTTERDDQVRELKEERDLLMDQVRELTEERDLLMDQGRELTASKSTLINNVIISSVYMVVGCLSTQSFQISDKVCFSLLS